MTPRCRPLLAIAVASILGSTLAGCSSSGNGKSSNGAGGAAAGAGGGLGGAGTSAGSGGSVQTSPGKGGADGAALDLGGGGGGPSDLGASTDVPIGAGGAQMLDGGGNSDLAGTGGTGGGRVDAEGGSWGGIDGGGSWVVTTTGGNGGPGVDGGTVTCTPGVVGAFVTGCGYPFASGSPLTSVVFNEDEVLRAIRPTVDQAGGVVTLLYNDEHALTLGVRQVVVKTAAGTTTTDYPVSPLSTNPGSVSNPQTGTNELAGDNSGLDPSLRPLWPVLYVTDVTQDPTSRAGDWQMGGRPISPSVVYGSWKSAVRTVDATKTPSAVSVTPDPDPAKNNWNLGISETIPSGIKDEGWSAEVKWNVSFQPGHSYRLQVIVHDGDQNKSGGDCGQACVVFCAGPSTPPPPPCPDQALVCGVGMAEGGGYAYCADGESCLNGCCATLPCPSGALHCGQLGAEGEIIECPSGSGTTCVGNCCIGTGE